MSPLLSRFLLRGGQTASSQLVRSKAGRPSAAAPDHETAAGRPRFAWTGPTGVATARRLSCDGNLPPIYTRGGTPVDVGRQTRVISSALRAFVVARDTTCRWPGYTMPARWSECHHVIHWRDGGRTDRANPIPIRRQHHKAAHDGRYTVILHRPGVVTVRRRRPGDPYYEIRTPAPPPPSPVPA